MFENVQSVCLAAAAVFDTVLLLALLERRNWPFVRVPIVAMMAGAWLWHAGQFSLLLLVDLPGAWPWYAQSLSMLAMAAGLLLMPCGLLHAAWRVWRNKIGMQARPESHHIFCYLPLLLVVPLTLRFFASGRRDFVAETAALEAPYFFLAGLVNVTAASLFLGVRRRIELPQARPFFLQLASVLIGITVLQVFVVSVARNAWPEAEGYWMLAVTLSPLAPALLFAYFVIRYNFLQIIVERSLVYGALLVSVLLLHQLAFQDVSAALPEVYRLHIVCLETVALVALILCYQPLRQRSAEALRYFLGIRVSGIREGLRQLSRELSAQTGRPVNDVLVWFEKSLRDALQVDYVGGWLFDPADNVTFRCGDTTRWTDAGARWLYQTMRSTDIAVCSRRHTPDRTLVQPLQEAAAALAVVKTRPNISGLLVIGRGRANRDLSEEETNAIVLLVEQLATTLDNSVLQAERLAAERKAMQSEKLSALGLLASSIAHEVKNPLSAIKTIATVLSEDLGPDSPHAEDLRLILGEIDRLATTTAQLLEIARPRSSPRTPASVPEALSGTLRLLRHLASQQDIAIDTRLADDLPPVQADEHSLREIFFNLLSNSLEAAGPGGRVSVQCQRENGYVVTEVRDSGPGMPPEVREHLFEPFLTTKQTGTGLGLYLVGRRVGELGGVIRCDSSAGQGTSFLVKLPYEQSTKNTDESSPPYPDRLQ
jgi:signal transduction histidine kinase